MQVFFRKHQVFLLVLLLTLGGGVLRFYNLNWGATLYFHPDERNIASSVSQLVFPTQLNPHFFAYGSLPIYVIFYTGLLLHHFAVAKISFADAIVISRSYSALFSVLLIPFLFLIWKQIVDDR